MKDGQVLSANPTADSAPILADASFTAVYEPIGEQPSASPLAIAIPVAVIVGYALLSRKKK